MSSRQKNDFVGCGDLTVGSEKSVGAETARLKIVDVF